jgi:signal transduction histidine kinase
MDGVSTPSSRYRPAWPGGTPVDTILVFCLAVGSVLGVASEIANAPDPVPAPIGGYLLAVAAAVPLLFRRRSPIAATAGVVAAILVYHLLGYPGLAPALCLFVAVYSAAAYARTRWGWLAGLAAVIAAWIIPLLPRYPVSWQSYSVTGPVIGLAATLVVGVSARLRRLDNEARIRAAATMADAQLRQRLAEDRLAIARELHDVLAHSMSIIAVQSGAALDAIDTDAPSAKQALHAIRDVAKRALPDLRGALALLRSGTEPADLHAQPRLSDLPDLVGSVRATGLAVTLSVATGDGDLAPLTELAAYRIVQEALTNVVRHADARSATVSVRREPAGLVIDIVDDGRGMTGARPGGLGLVGMTERATLVGGTVDIATAPTGSGTAVHATLPVASEPESTAVEA